VVGDECAWCLLTTAVASRSLSRGTKKRQTGLKKETGIAQEEETEKLRRGIKIVKFKVEGIE